MENQKIQDVVCCNEIFATRAELMGHLEAEHDERCPTRIALSQTQPEIRAHSQPQSSCSIQQHVDFGLQEAGFAHDQRNSSSPHAEPAEHQFRFSPTQRYFAHQRDRENRELQIRILRLAMNMKPKKPSPLSLNMWTASPDLGIAARSDGQQVSEDAQMINGDPMLQQQNGQQAKMLKGKNHTNVGPSILTFSAATMEPINPTKKGPNRMGFPGFVKAPESMKSPPKTQSSEKKKNDDGCYRPWDLRVLPPVGTLDDFAVTPRLYEPLKYHHAPVTYHMTIPNYCQSAQYFRLTAADPNSASEPFLNAQLGQAGSSTIPPNRTPEYMVIQAEAISDAQMELYRSLKNLDPFLPRLASLAALGPRPKIAPFPPPAPGITYGQPIRCIYESYPEKQHHLIHTPKDYLLKMIDLIGMTVPFAGNIILDSLWMNYANVRPQPTEEDDAKDEDFPRPAAAAGLKRDRVGGATGYTTPDPDLVIARFHWCMKCHGVYDIRHNDDDVCKYHPGKKIPNASRSGIWNAFYQDEDPEGMIASVANNEFFLRYFDWTCCGRQGEDVGCKIGRHTPAERENMNKRQKVQKGHA